MNDAHTRLLTVLPLLMALALFSGFYVTSRERWPDAWPVPVVWIVAMAAYWFGSDLANLNPRYCALARCLLCCGAGGGVAVEIV